MTLCACDRIAVYQGEKIDQILGPASGERHSPWIMFHFQ